MKSSPLSRVAAPSVRGTTGGANASFFIPEFEIGAICLVVAVSLVPAFFVFGLVFFYLAFVA